QFAERGSVKEWERESASDEGRSHAAPASVRLLSELFGRLTTGQRLADRGDLAQAARLLPEIEDLLQRGIGCGALADPWNILGFQALFPLFASRQDSVRDPRIDELIDLVAGLFDLYARLLSEAAAAGNQALIASLTPKLRRRAAWWDRF